MALVLRLVSYVLALANCVLFGHGRFGRIQGEGWGAGWANLIEMALACLISIALLIVLGVVYGFGRSERWGLEAPHGSLVASLLALPLILTAALVVWVKLGGRGLQ